MGAKDDLLKLLGGSEGVKETRRLTSGALDREEVKRVLSEQTGAAPLRLCLTFDTTGSMRYIISAVRDVASQVGTEILSAERGIEAYVLGVGDHGDKDEIARVRKTGLKMLGDYGQDNTPTTEVEAFVRQVNSIVETNGGDIPEAYECLAKDLCERIMKDKQAAPQRKNIVVFFGDSMPHGNCQRGNYSDGGDSGCPYEIDARQLTALGTLADHSYWVDCTDFAATASGIFRQHTFSHLEGLSNATYLRFADAAEVLPEAIIGMVRKAQGADELQKYLAQLEAGNGGKAAKVAGLLGTGRK